MNILVNRYYSDDDTTLSIVKLGDFFACHGLEDEYRKKKVYGKTRIPAGKYNIELRQAGRVHQKYKKKFDFHKGVLWIKNVPGFKWIYIHCGYVHTHTEGCLLIGMTSHIGDLCSLEGSEKAYTVLYPLIYESAKSGNLTIEFEDNDGTKTTNKKRN